MNISKVKIVSERSSSRLPLRVSLLLSTLALTWLCVSAHNSFAVTPAPDGGYPGFNTAEGTDALFNLTTGVYNTATGFNSLHANLTGSGNTANGATALYSNTTGSYNTAVGEIALYSNLTGSSNTAVGDSALLAHTMGDSNTAVGVSALRNDVTGAENTAVGHNALVRSDAGLNTAVGYSALHNDTSGGLNMANGYEALYNNTTGNYNTADGMLALFSNTTGNYNTAIGAGALYQSSTGSNNVAVGALAGSAVITANNVICIGTGVEGADADNTCFIGNIYETQLNGIPVLVDSSGQLGTATSSRRFKKDIKPMGRASEAILSLKPVTFQYKNDKTNTSQFGLIAEDVAKVDTNLVVRDPDGKPYTVRYDAVNAMLLNEFLKQHEKVEKQNRKLQQSEAKITELKQDFHVRFADHEKQINALASGLQKVTAQLELNKTARKVVANRSAK